jgi:two-component system nitrogen regulation response regulator GlnG
MPPAVSKLLIIDDEPAIVYSLTDCLESSELTVRSANTGRDGISQVQNDAPDVILLDVRLPDQSGLDVFEKIHEIEPRIPVIIMTAFAKTETAIEAMRRGAFDYLLKPVDVSELRVVVDKAIEVSRLNRIPATFNSEDNDEDGSDRIVGQSPQMQEVYKMIGRIAAQDATVLILGESGTGKELVARAIYHYSRRSKLPFLAINCAALPEALLESELFGHERGAFTGADQRRIGKFEQVNGGTIFLDEIGDMSAATQAKALRLLQQQQFERVGGNQTIQTDVRIIAATNVELETLVDEGEFRRDLYYRLNGFTIKLPALRERKEDIPLLVACFISHFNRKLNRNIQAISPDAIDRLMQHEWPGNIRELRSAIQFAIVQSSTDVITADCLPDKVAKKNHERLRGVGAAEPNLDAGLMQFVRSRLADSNGTLYEEVVNHVDAVVLQTVLEHTSGQIAATARLLGISRNTLRSKLRSLGMQSDRGEEKDSSEH